VVQPRRGESRQLDGARDLLDRTDDDHAPAGAATRIDPVDLERDPLGAQQRRQLRARGGAKHD
jgi:hypothetical protein